MKILFTRFPLESVMGGTEVQTISLMKGLRERGHDVSFLGSCPMLLRLCREERIPATELRIGPPPVTKWFALSFLWRRVAMHKTLITAFDHAKPDVVCMLSLSEKILLTTHAAEKDSRVFWIEHDRIGRWLIKNPWLKPLRRQSRSATTICVSDLSRTMYLHLGWDPTKTIAIPNGIDEAISDKRLAIRTNPNPTMLTADRYPLTASSLPLRIGVIARLSSDKGIDILINAVSRVPQATLTIIGRGWEERSLLRLINALDLSERVRILPQIEDLGDFYRSLDVSVLPSRDHDPFGLVAAEAMLCGTATIVTDACGIAGYLQHETDALIVPAADAAALSAAIQRLMDAGIRKKIAATGQKTAKRIFSLSAMVSAYETLFTESLLRERS